MKILRDVVRIIYLIKFSLQIVTIHGISSSIFTFLDSEHASIPFFSQYFYTNKKSYFIFHQKNILEELWMSYRSIIKYIFITFAEIRI